MNESSQGDGKEEKLRRRLEFRKGAEKFPLRKVGNHCCRRQLK